MGRHDNEPYAMHPDNCERCAGVMGGVRGNENRYPDSEQHRVEGYRILCDYCSVEIDNGLDREIMCNYCERPWSTHVLMPIAQVEAIWEQGIYVLVCGSEMPFDIAANGHDKLVLVSMIDDKPADPCDEEYMKEISS
jgi:hypothetical protein